MFYPPKDRVRGTEKVNFMATCLCDSIFSNAAISAVEVLKKFTGKVIFPADQTCCGQPAFNSGDFPSARKVILSTMRAFSGNDAPIIVPSASCAAMLYHSSLVAFRDESPAVRAEVEAFASRVWEMCDYLVNVAGVESLGGKMNSPTRIALHHSCHGKGSGTPAALTKLVSSIENVELLDFENSDSCCGFGGTFSVVFPQISSEMGEVKVRAVAAVNPDFVVAADTSCLMHQKGIAEKLGIKYPARHSASLFFEAMKNGGKI